MRAQVRLAIGVSAIFATLPASAHSLKLSRGAYDDSDGLTRERLGADAQVEAGRGPAGLTGHTYKLSFLRDSFAEEDLEDDDYTREVYGSEQRVQGTATLSATQTWNKTTETRALGSYASDGKVTTRTFGVGASQWMPGESLRIGVDFSRTLVDQPLFQVLDYDSELVGAPSRYSATGSTLGIRHLATPSTILDYALSYVHNEHRPATKVGGLQLRQFVALLKGAAHAGVTRADNRGAIDTTTDYGQVDAWTYEGAWLQHLWQGAQGRLGYRYYREDETTRAYEDERVFGSDTASLGLAQELDERTAGVPMVVEAIAARYLTNSKLAATTFEVGLTAKF